ncbi:MAG: sigma-70 family RNA polymerase sigma factor, partial [Planctomycetes bacterium]|nr:sigma-70 family RNA polymerase sigma factor [Planctomycetota bacterium]
EGDRQALGDLLQQHQDRLMRLVSFRLDRRLQGRVDPADVLQEAFVEVTRRRKELPHETDMALFVWLRFLVLQKLLEVHRRHLGVQARNATRDVSLYDGGAPHVTSAVLAAQLLGKLTSPSQAAIRAEMKYRLEQTLNAMSSLDREIIVLRHFEQLANAEAAHVLGISESAASTRYVRAIRRLRQSLEGDA